MCHPETTAGRAPTIVPANAANASGSNADTRPPVHPFKANHPNLANPVSLTVNHIRRRFGTRDQGEQEPAPTGTVVRLAQRVGRGPSVAPGGPGDDESAALGEVDGALTCGIVGWR